jgi:hypothetical protein
MALTPFVPTLIAIQVQSAARRLLEHQLHLVMISQGAAIGINE